MSISFNQLNGTTVSDASGNTTLGTFSLQSAEGQRGLNNTAMGCGALRANAPSGQHNTAIGLNALSNNAGSNNLAIGENALYNFPNPSTPQTGSLNVAVGNNAMYANTTGNENIAIGNQALSNNTTGSKNAVVGIGAAYNNTIGSKNAALGYNAMLNNTTGSDNVAIGDGALVNNQTSNSNVAVGKDALQAHTSGNGNVAVGNFALSLSNTSKDNLAIGRHVSANNKSSCILLGNHAQTINDSELAMSGINIVGTISPVPAIVGYMPIRLNNYTIGGTPGTPLQQYYIPLYAAPAAPLPVPEVIIANHSSLGSLGTGGVGLLVGFPSAYSAASVTSVVITNPNTGGSYTISTTPSTTGYYVFYEDVESGFWTNIPSSYTNLAQAPVLSPGLCGGLVFGNGLTFTYVISGTSTTISYTPLVSLGGSGMGDGYQYQQYNGQAAFTPPSVFQWGGTGTGTTGSQLWGEQVGTGTQTYTAWQAVAGNYQYNSIYKQLHPYTSATALAAPVGSLTISIGSRAVTYPYYEPLLYSWITNSSSIILTPNFPNPTTNTSRIGTTPNGSEISSNAANGVPISVTIQPSYRNTSYYMTVIDPSGGSTNVIGGNKTPILYSPRLINAIAVTPTPTPTPNPTPAPTPTPTGTPAPTPTPSPTHTPNPTPTPSPTPNPTPTPTGTPNPTPTPSPTPNPTPTPTGTPLPTPTPTVTIGLTPNPTTTPTPTPNPTPSPTPNPTPSPTPNPTPSPTPNPTPNPTPSPTPNPTPSPTPNPTPSPTPNPTPTPTPNPTPTPTPNPTPSPTPTPNTTPSPTPTQSSGLVLDGNTIKYTSSGSLSTSPTFIYANPRGTGSEWFAVVNDSSKSAINTAATTGTNNPTAFTYTPSGQSAVNIPFNNVVTTRMTDMSSMFYGATTFNQAIASWDTSNVTLMTNMFYGATAFNRDISAWKTNMVNGMAQMFSGASAFNQAIGSWNTTAVGTMSNMFLNASAFNSQINFWNTSAVTNMSAMFSGASSFNQAISLWNTSKVSTMDSMFYGATAFNQDISSWNTSSVGTMNSMFRNATVFNNPINSVISNSVTTAWNIRSVTDMASMFYGAAAFNQPINLWDTANVLNMDNMFGSAVAFNQDISTWNVSSVVVKPPTNFNVGATLFAAASASGYQPIWIQPTATTKWVAGGAAGSGTSGGTASVAYSKDGTAATSWTAGSPVKPIDTVYGVTYIANNGTWIAVGTGTTDNPKNVAYSRDGINWTADTTLLSNLYGVTYSERKSQLVIVGSRHTLSTANFYYQNTSASWLAYGFSLSSTVISQLNTVYGIAYSPQRDLYVAVGSQYNSSTYPIVYFSYTSDYLAYNMFYGATNSGSIFTEGRGVAYSTSQNMWVAVGSGTNTIATSTNDIANWTGHGKTIFSITGHGVAYSESQSLWVAVGEGTNSIAFSTNGTTWTAVANSTAIFTIGYSIAYSETNSVWVATGQAATGGASIAYSTNGTTWTKVSNSSGIFNTGYGVDFATPFLPVAPLIFGGYQTAGNTAALARYDGTFSNLYDWFFYKITAYTGYSNTTSLGINNIIWNGNIWFAIGSEVVGGTTTWNVIFTSNDGVNWNRLGWSYATGGTVNFYDIHWNGSHVVAVGSTGDAVTILYSNVGGGNVNGGNPWGTPTYPTNVTTTNLILTGVTYNGTNWFAIGYRPTGNFLVLFRSTTKSPAEWTDITPSFMNTAFANVSTFYPRITYSGDKLIICAPKQLYVSSNGSTWTTLPTALGGSGVLIRKCMRMYDKLILICSDGTSSRHVNYSTDNGTTWTGMGPYLSTGAAIYDIKMINSSTAMMVGTDGASSIYMTSTDGINWIPTGTPGSAGIASLSQSINVFAVSGQFSEFILNSLAGGSPYDIPLNGLSDSILSNSYISSINVVPTWFYAPSLTMTGIALNTNVNLTLTVTQQIGGTTTTVAVGSITLSSNNSYTNGIIIKLTPHTQSTYIAATATVTYTMSSTTSISGGILKLNDNFGLVGTLHGRSYFLPSTFTIPNTASTRYIPTPITYYPNKGLYYNKITTSTPSTAANNIQYSITPSTVGVTTAGFTSAMNLLILDSTSSNNPATTNTNTLKFQLVTSYMGNEAYLGTSLITTSYIKNYIPISPQTEVYCSKSGWFDGVSGGSYSSLGGTGFPWGVGDFKSVISSGTPQILTINATSDMTLNEFNFGYKDLLGVAGYYTYNNNVTFTMKVISGSTTLTTVSFKTVLPPVDTNNLNVSPSYDWSKTALGLTQNMHFAQTYNEAYGNRFGANDGTLLSIPFYDISGNLPSYVSNFTISGTPKPAFSIGDKIKITFEADASFNLATSFTDPLITTGLMAGALISTPSSGSADPYSNSVYNFTGSSITTTSNRTVADLKLATGMNNVASGTISSLVQKTMYTGFYIKNIYIDQVAAGTNQFHMKLLIYNTSATITSTTVPVLAVYFSISIPGAYSTTDQSLYIPFSYVSIKNSTRTATSATLVSNSLISFLGEQNPIFEIGSTLQYRLCVATPSTTVNPISITYTSTTSGSETLVGSMIGIKLLAYTNLTMPAVTTPIKAVVNKTVTIPTAYTSPINVGGAITYIVDNGTISGSTYTVPSTSPNTYINEIVTASQSATALYKAGVATTTFDIIGPYATPFHPFSSIATQFTISDTTTTNTPFVCYVNIVSNSTKVSGLNFLNYGSYSIPAGRTVTMSLLNANTNTECATTSFTTNKILTNTDGGLLFFPFIHGDFYSTTASATRIYKNMPTGISSMTGTINKDASGNNMNVFNAGDLICIKLTVDAGNISVQNSSGSMYMRCSIYSQLGVSLSLSSVLQQYGSYTWYPLNSIFSYARYTYVSFTPTKQGNVMGINCAGFRCPSGSSSGTIYICVNGSSTDGGYTINKATSQYVMEATYQADANGEVGSFTCIFDYGVQTAYNANHFTVTGVRDTNTYSYSTISYPIQFKNNNCTIYIEFPSNQYQVPLITATGGLYCTVYGYGLV